MKAQDLERLRQSRVDAARKGLESRKRNFAIKKALGLPLRNESKRIDGQLKKYLVQPNGCWDWTGAKDKRSGYGKVGTHRKIGYAHRLFYEKLKGPIDEGMDICHSCDNRSCVNPDHLWIGTREENELDKTVKGRDPRRNPTPEEVKRWELLMKEKGVKI